MTYHTIKNIFYKPIIYAGLAAMIMAGCAQNDAKDTEKKMPEQKYSENSTKDTEKTNTTEKTTPQEELKEPERTYFEDWGFVDKINNWSYEGPFEVRTADLDGDGDLDIIVGTYKDGLKIYENRIPQSKHKIR